jgi:hypothetical protein
MIRDTRAPRAALILGLLLGGVVVTSCSFGTISDARVVRWVEQTVAERQAPPEDKRFDEIGWVTDIRTAIELGKEYNRPIFLFTGNGRINTGRC